MVPPFLLILFLLLLLGCSREASRVERASSPPAAGLERSVAPADEGLGPPEHRPADGPFFFVDVAAARRLRFRHAAPLTPQRHIHLFMGSGVGWLDYDRDGWPDLFYCQGGAYDPSGQSVPSSGAAPSDLLFQNRGGSDFSNVTQQAGLVEGRFTMGVAAADYDHDGFVDLVTTGYGENGLWRNNGDGSFTRVPLPLAEQVGRLSASCAWGDVDGDGNLDLFITNYAQLDPRNYPTCEYTVGDKTIPISCHPSKLTPLSDLLYRNLGDGSFEDISTKAGIGVGTPRCGLGVIAADLDQDGDIDFYVANDTTSNHLWENQGRGQFIDRGDDSGTARNRYGANEAGMGLVAGEISGRGQIDLFVTNYYGETNTLYRNEGSLLFSDATDEVGLGAPSKLRLGFGTSLADFDGDGWLDLAVVNGHVQDRLPEVGRNEPFAQLPLLFHSQGGSRFREVSAGAGVYFGTAHVGRSTAVADFDGDGDIDIAVNGLNEEAALLENRSGDQGNWLQLELIGVESNRGGVGTLLRLEAGGRTLLRCVHAGCGYLSCDASGVLVGIGAADQVERLTATWPGGRRESWRSLQAGRLWRLVEGSGE